MAMSLEHGSSERAFSHNCCCFTQLHLDNALRIAMDDRMPADFPYDCLPYIPGRYGHSLFHAFMYKVIQCGGVE